MLKLEVNFSYCRNTKMIKFIHKCFHNHTWQCMWVCMCVWVRVCVCVVCVCSMVCVVCVCAYVRVCVRASLVKWPGNQSTNWTNWKVVGSILGVATLVLLFFLEEETLPSVPNYINGDVMLTTCGPLGLEVPTPSPWDMIKPHLRADY